MGEIQAYLERLEVIAFFAAFPLMFLVFREIMDTSFFRKFKWVGRMQTVPGMAYALTGTLFTGMIIHDLYPHYSALPGMFSLIRLWGFSSILFWIPALHKRAWLSFIHSLPFFYFVFKDIIDQVTGSPPIDILKNDVKLYTDSLLINVCTLIFITGFQLLVWRWKSPKQP